MAGYCTFCKQDKPSVAVTGAEHTLFLCGDCVGRLLDERDSWKNGYERILNATDSEMRDGDLAREIAMEVLPDAQWELTYDEFIYSNKVRYTKLPTRTWRKA